MFSFIQTKFIPPVQLAGASLDNEINAIEAYFRSGNRIAEFCNSNSLEASSIPASWASAQTKPLVLLRLEKDDADPGRFWTLLVMGLRQYQPKIGLTVLNTILDHHDFPAVTALAQLAKELSGFHFTFVLDGIQHLYSQDWWPGYVSWLQSLPAENQILLLNSAALPSLPQYLISLPQRQLSEPELVSAVLEDWIANLNPELHINLAAMDSWWLPWLQIQFDGQPAHADLITLKETGFISEAQGGVWIPFSQLIRQLHSENLSQPDGTVITKIRALTAWLAQQGEWLESIRYALKAGDFEDAAALFEQNVESFLQNPNQALTILFWLKEMPGILLTSRPILCWLAAALADQLGLALQVKSFLDAAENNLMSLSHFSRSQEKWRSMEVSEAGVTVADLMERIEKLRSK